MKKWQKSFGLKVTEFPKGTLLFRSSMRSNEKNKPLTNSYFAFGPNLPLQIASQVGLGTEQWGEKIKWFWLKVRQKVIIMFSAVPRNSAEFPSFRGKLLIVPRNG